VSEPYRHVVCAVESEEVSAPAIRESARLAGLGAERLSLVHVVDSAAGFSGGRTSRSGPAASVEGHLEEEARAWLGPLAARLGGTPVVLVGDDAPGALRGWAAAEAADLIVACPHRRGLRRVLGSFASAIVRDAPCPVLLAA
jgi:nucleotide-binding universal stress UspA family protein